MLTGENDKVRINFANKNLHILDISQITQAERYTIKLVQSKYFNEEMKKLLMKKQGSEEAEIKKSSQIYNLDSYIDEDGIIRVGGRLDKSIFNNECKHPIVLPKGSPTSKLTIAWCHKKLATQLLHLTKSKGLDFGLYVRILQHKNLYITVLYADV